jgi:hypothetical protein
MHVAPNPRFLTGWFGASSHVLRFPLRGLSSGFPVARRVPSPLFAFLRIPFRPASSGSLPSAVARCRFSFGFPPGSLSLGNIHASAAAGRFPPALVPGGRDQGHQSCRDRLAWIARSAAHCRWAAAGHDGMPPQNRLLRAAASAVHRRKRTAQIGGSGARLSRALHAKVRSLRPRWKAGPAVCLCTASAGLIARICRESSRGLLTWGTAAQLLLRGGSRPSVPRGAAIPAQPERP